MMYLKDEAVLIIAEDKGYKPDFIKRMKNYWEKFNTRKK